jgi:hypothetical protein
VAETGFEIKGRFYPLAAAFRLGDPVLVERVTGLDWPAFTARLPEEDSDPSQAEDIVVTAGLLAVSVWQQHPHWRRERVASYVEQLDLSKVKFIAGEDDVDPPAVTQETSPGENSSKTTPTPSSEEPGSGSEPSTPSSSGTPDSDTGSQDSLLHE